LRGPDSNHFNKFEDMFSDMLNTSAATGIARFVWLRTNAGQLRDRGRSWCSPHLVLDAQILSAGAGGNRASGRSPSVGLRPRRAAMDDLRLPRLFSAHSVFSWPCHLGPLMAVSPLVAPAGLSSLPAACCSREHPVTALTAIYGKRRG
jgi:hypothetical protein